MNSYKTLMKIVAQMTARKRITPQLQLACELNKEISPQQLTKRLLDYVHHAG